MRSAGWVAAWQKRDFSPEPVRGGQKAGGPHAVGCEPQAQLKLEGADGGGNVTGVGSSGARVLTVLGTIPGNQNPVPGEYADTVTMTVNY